MFWQKGLDTAAVDDVRPDRSTPPLPGLFLFLGSVSGSMIDTKKNFKYMPIFAFNETRGSTFSLNAPIRYKPQSQSSNPRCEDPQILFDAKWLPRLFRKRSNRLFWDWVILDICICIAGGRNAASREGPMGGVSSGVVEVGSSLVNHLTCATVTCTSNLSTLFDVGQSASQYCLVGCYSLSRNSYLSFLPS